LTFSCYTVSYGTQCANLVRDYGFVYLTAGKLLCAELGLCTMAKKSPPIYDGSDVLSGAARHADPVYIAGGRARGLLGLLGTPALVLFLDGLDDVFEERLMAST